MAEDRIKDTKNRTIILSKKKLFQNVEKPAVKYFYAFFDIL